MHDGTVEPEAEELESAWAQQLTGKYPALKALLESGRATLGKPKTPGLYAPTGFRLPPGLSSQDLLNWGRRER